MNFQCAWIAYAGCRDSGTLYGEDDTGIYAEGIAAGLLPKIDDLSTFYRIPLFKGMHAEENHRPPGVSYVSLLRSLMFEFQSSYM
jgi:hypothetical protein